jgi:hypothetical protein
VTCRRRRAGARKEHSRITVRRAREAQKAKPRGERRTSRRAGRRRLDRFSMCCRSARRRSDCSCMCWLQLCGLVVSSRSPGSFPDCAGSRRTRPGRSRGASTRSRGVRSPSLSRRGSGTSSRSPTTLNLTPAEKWTLMQAFTAGAVADVQALGQQYNLTPQQVSTLLLAIGSPSQRVRFVHGGRMQAVDQARRSHAGDPRLHWVDGGMQGNAVIGDRRDRWMESPVGLTSVRWRPRGWHR